MNKNSLLSSLVLSFTLVWASSAFSQKVGIFDRHTDVGTNVKPGSATFIPQTGQYVISGAGYNVWGDHDEFQFVWKKMKGDFILYTKAEFVGNWVDYHRKVGWMVRKTLDGNSPHINAVDEVVPDMHPPYKHVHIRYMPITGGTPKVLAYIYGGQGSINTPSWSPDSKRIAFISNSDMSK